MHFIIRILIVEFISLNAFCLWGMKPDHSLFKSIWSEGHMTAETPCISTPKNVCTCRQLGMKANDYNSRATNTRILIDAINAGYKIKCDNTYFLEGNNGDIRQGINIYGKGCLIFCNAIKIVSNIPYIELNGITVKSYDSYCGKAFDENVNTAFILPPGAKRFAMENIAIKDCLVENISLLRFQNRSGDSVHHVFVEGNTWKNMSYVGMAIGSTNIDSLRIHKNKAYKVVSRLFDFGTATSDIIKKAVVTGNYLSNKGYFTKTNEFYAGLAVIECIDAYCDGNVVEDFLVANPKVNLYDIYCNCTNLVYTNNKKHNVLNMQDINLLCKAKSFKGEHGSRIVEGNSYVVEDDVINKYRDLIASDCCIKLMTLSANEVSQQDLLSIKNNIISALLPCSFGMTGGVKVQRACIQDNTIRCSSIAGGDTYLSGNIEDAYVSNNTIKPVEKVSGSTPAMKIRGGRYVLEDCSMSAFPGVAEADVESVVRRCNLTFSYSEKPSPNVSIGGVVEDCVIDFQGYDLTNNFNIYLAKAKNELSVSDLKVKNAPKDGTLWFRYLLDKQRSADYLELKIEFLKQTKVVWVDNVSRIVYISNRKYPVKESKQSVDLSINDSKTLKLTFYGDRLGITGLSDNMKFSIKELSNAQFNAGRAGK